MAWIKLDDGLPEHAKIISVGGDAAWLHICALAYANRNLTDGHIPTGVLHRLSDRRQAAKLAARLVAVGMWHLDDDGWLIHDYLEYQPPRAKVMEEREKARERMAKARGSSTDVQANNPRSSPNPDPTRPDPSFPVTSHDGQTLPAVSESVSPSSIAIQQALNWYAANVYRLDPAACKKGPTGRVNYERGIARRKGEDLRAELAAYEFTNATARQIAESVLSLTESDLLAIGAIEREDPYERLARKRREAGLNGAAS